MYPSMHRLWGRWAPQSEVGPLTGVCYAGQSRSGWITNDFSIGCPFQVLNGKRVRNTFGQFELWLVLRPLSSPRRVRICSVWSWNSYSVSHFVGVFSFIHSWVVLYTLLFRNHSHVLSNCRGFLKHFGSSKTFCVFTHACQKPDFLSFFLSFFSFSFFFFFKEKIANYVWNSSFLARLQISFLVLFSCGVSVLVLPCLGPYIGNIMAYLLGGYLSVHGFGAHHGEEYNGSNWPSIFYVFGKWSVYVCVCVCTCVCVCVCVSEKDER